jgi:hypothetical protein
LSSFFFFFFSHLIYIKIECSSVRFFFFHFIGYARKYICCYVLLLLKISVNPHLYRAVHLCNRALSFSFFLLLCLCVWVFYYTSIRISLSAIVWFYSTKFILICIENVHLLKLGLVSFLLFVFLHCLK